jgi:cytochrome c
MGGEAMVVVSRVSVVLSVAAGIAAFTFAPSAAGEWATKEDAVALVKQATGLIKQRGPEKAYPELSNKAGRFHDRDLYITVLDFNGKVLAHGLRGDLVGRNLIKAKDPDGKLYIKERVDLAREQSTFWQNYKWLNPTTKEVEPQDAYCERLNDTAVCGAVYSF